LTVFHWQEVLYKFAVNDFPATTVGFTATIDKECVGFFEDNETVLASQCLKNACSITLACVMIGHYDTADAGSVESIAES
jgi:hypothetical protein